MQNPLHQSLLIFLALLVFAPSSFANNNPIVAIDAGPIRGKESADGKMRIFLGIPYAAPPVGPLRWKPPQPAAPWKEVRDATSFGHRCMQAHVYDDMIFRDSGMSEDCLNLNIWAPAAAAGAKLPVMVWIYGGGFQAGATSEPRQDGETLARHGVIVVSMNYRLGIFGFLATHELAAESPQHAAGNYGLMDQSLAIRWVKNNISAFGGDPANITIFGESAGSFSVSFQMASPLSRDLMARAIGESGAAFGKSDIVDHDLAATQAADEKFAREDLHAESLSALRALSADELIQKTSPRPNFDAFRFMPTVDGYFLPQKVDATFAAGKQAKIPLLAGWNKDELSFARIAGPKVDLKGLSELASKRFGANAAEFLKVYHATTDAEAAVVAGNFADDAFLGYCTWAWLEAQVATGQSPVYRFRFDLGVPGGPKHPAALGAFHSDEIEYVFGTLDSRPNYTWRPEDYKLSELMQVYWTNFAKTGNPNAEGLPNWPTYNPAFGWQLMHLDAVSAARPDDHRDRYLFLQKSWTK
jgi:para-nitrobenzyl esterase